MAWTLFDWTGPNLRVEDTTPTPLLICETIKKWFRYILPLCLLHTHSHNSILPSMRAIATPFRV